MIGDWLTVHRVVVWAMLVGCRWLMFEGLVVNDWHGWVGGLGGWCLTVAFAFANKLLYWGWNGVLIPCCSGKIWLHEPHQKGVFSLTPTPPLPLEHIFALSRNVLAPLISKMYIFLLIVTVCHCVKEASAARILLLQACLHVAGCGLCVTRLPFHEAILIGVWLVHFWLAIPPYSLQCHPSHHTSPPVTIIAPQPL